MASKYWIKLYHEILHDPKMGRMSDTLWRRTIELFLLAGEFDQDGVLPSIEEMSWTLRITEDECNETLHQLQRLQIVHCNDKGEWVVTKFLDRQSAANNTERSRQFRQRKQREKRMQPLRQAPEEPESNQNQPIEAPKEPEPEILEPSLPETKMQRNVAPDTDSDITPNGVSDQSSLTKQDIIELGKLQPKKALSLEFTRLTGIPEPDNKTDKKFWWSSIGRFWEVSETDIDIGLPLMRKTVKTMKADGLLISDPNSLIKTARAIRGEEKTTSAVVDLASSQYQGSYVLG